MKTRLLTLIIAMLATVAVSASELADSVGADTPAAAPDTSLVTMTDSAFHPLPAPKPQKSIYDNIYAQPYSQNKNVNPNWGRLWANTGVLTGAFVGTLFVLECLPEDATAWNRAELQDTPLFKRWYNHVIKEGPEWDHDKFIFNYVLHPYAGAVYFMAARSCGFGFWRSMLYSTLISNIGWEFGIEAFMERPSYQDLFITPVIGSCIGEAFYRVKRDIVGHDYMLCGSRILGNIVVFLVDPVNEVVNLFRGSDTRRLHLGRDARKRPGVESSLTPVGACGAPGFTLTVNF